MTEAGEDMGSYDEHAYNVEHPKITFRVTPEEKAALEREAKGVGKSLAEMIRDRVVTRSSPGNDILSPGTSLSSPGNGNDDVVSDLKAALRELWRFFNNFVDNPSNFDAELSNLDTQTIDKGVKRCE